MSNVKILLVILLVLGLLMGGCASEPVTTTITQTNTITPNPSTVTSTVTVTNTPETLTVTTTLTSSTSSTSSTPTKTITTSSPEVELVVVFDQSLSMASAENVKITKTSSGVVVEGHVNYSSGGNLNTWAKVDLYKADGKLIATSTVNFKILSMIGGDFEVVFTIDDPSQISKCIITLGTHKS